MKQKRLLVLIPVAIVLLLIIIVGSTILASYNSTVEMREDVDGNYAQVTNRLQQRHDKMEQIISAVQGLQDHAEDLYALITEARAAYSAAKDTDGYIQSDATDAEVLSRLLVVVEDNPDISASSAYYAYIDEVSAIENALTVARKDYNDSVRKYNAAVKKFPRVLYLKMFGFEKELSYWQLPDGAGDIPLVNFAD